MRQNANDFQPSCLLAWPLITASAVTHGADWKGFLPYPSLLCSCEHSTLVARGISRTLVSGDAASLYLDDSRDATFCNLCDLHQLGRIAGHTLYAHCQYKVLDGGLGALRGYHVHLYHMTATAEPLTCCSLSWYQVAKLLWAWGQPSPRLSSHAAAVGSSRRQAMKGNLHVLHLAPAYGGGDGATEAEEALLARACLSQFLIVSDFQCMCDRLVMNAPPFGGGAAATEAQQGLSVGQGVEMRIGGTEAAYGSTSSPNGTHNGAHDPELANTIRRESSRAAANLMRLSGQPKENGDISSRRVIYQQVRVPTEATQKQATGRHWLGLISCCSVEFYHCLPSRGTRCEVPSSSAAPMKSQPSTLASISSLGALRSAGRQG